MAKTSPAYFDTVGQFDNSYFDITNNKYGQFIKAHNKLMDSNKELVNFTRVSNTLDSEGMVTASTETTDTDVEVFIMPMTEEDRKLTGRGVSVEGSIKLLCDRSYDLTNNGDGTKFEVGDIITRLSDGTDSDWRIKTINRNYAFGGEIFRTCFLKRMEA